MRAVLELRVIELGEDKEEDRRRRIGTEERCEGYGNDVYDMILAFMARSCPTPRPEKWDGLRLASWIREAEGQITLPLCFKPKVTVPLYRPNS